MDSDSPTDQVEPFIHSYVIRIWLEDAGAENSGPVWRGHITHIPGEERKYLNDLSEIPAFIESYLTIPSTPNP